MGRQVVFHREIPVRQAKFGDLEAPLAECVQSIIRASGISRLYSHQAEAVNLIRSGRHVVVSTPTASGKTLIYNLPVIEQALNDPSSHALYLFPLKALAHDQMKTLGKMTAVFPMEEAPTYAAYDGDTTAWERKKIRDMPPNILLTNPEMLHLSLLAHHSGWSRFWKGLTHVVVDEVHTYRGVMGSHMAWVFRRLKRICGKYGSDPVFVFCSATAGNPGELTSELAGVDVDVVTSNGAPQGRRHILFLNPDEGAAMAAVQLLKAALHRRLRTIVYTQSRKMTELVSIWTSWQAKDFSDRIAAYRAGFLPEERRTIEKKLSDGTLLAVISTSALELGIDIGALDLCILVGYPGTVAATWQRGGRVGRAMQDCAVVLVAHEDALDQYFMRNPDDFLKRPPEPAVINRHNPAIMKKHIQCAASETAIGTVEPWLSEGPVAMAVSEMEFEGALLRSREGDRLFSPRKMPHRHVDLRGTGSPFQIIDRTSGKTVGDIDGMRAYRETHPGAVYLHQGIRYLVDSLNLEIRTVEVSPVKTDYFTRVRGAKSTEIMEVLDRRTVYGAGMCFGTLRIRDQVIGYERRHVRGQRLLGRVPLDLPPQEFETQGIWVEIPDSVQRAVEHARMHFMGGIHAVEHAAIGILPLLVLTDRNDLGGISIPCHPQLGKAAVFVYDGIPGGVGLSRMAYEKGEDLLRQTLSAVRECRCEVGCPSCVHSPKCGSGNRPIDKDAAVHILESIVDGSTGKMVRSSVRGRSSGSGDRTQVPEEGRKCRTETPPAGWRQDKEDCVHFGVFDLETQLSALEAGGWHRADLMKMSCAVVYDSANDEFTEYRESDIQGLLDHLAGLEMVVGFNVKRFDYKVLSGYSGMDFWKLPTLDLLEDLHRQLGYRLSLDHLARVTLGMSKSADGLQALKWWREGKILEIIEYCRHDVEITRELFLFGCRNGYLLFRNKAGQDVRVPVNWREKITCGSGGS